MLATGGQNSGNPEEDRTKDSIPERFYTSAVYAPAPGELIIACSSNNASNNFQTKNIHTEILIFNVCLGTDM